MTPEDDSQYPRRPFFALLVLLPLLTYGAMLAYEPLSRLLHGLLGAILPLTASAMVSYWLILDRRLVRDKGGATAQEQVLHLALFALALLWLGLSVALGIGTIKIG